MKKLLIGLLLSSSVFATEYAVEMKRVLKADGVLLIFGRFSDDE